MSLLDNPVTEMPSIAAADYDLGQRYEPGAGPVLLTGVQAIARLLVEQHHRDAGAGLNTASFVSGYQGSPLGGVDRMLLGMPDVLEANAIKFVPGMNEELAATAVWGSQSELPGATPLYDGVVGVWYGKGPGVDRAMDCLRHANMYGVNADGGFLLLVGDDPASKSSTVPAVSERTLAALNIPVLFPRNATEIIQLGMQGIALSRASGCIVALKIVADVADGAWIVDESASWVRTDAPEVQWRGRPYEYRQRPMAVASHLILPAEEELFGPRSEIVTAFAGLNALNRIEVAGDNDTVGIVASGTAFDSLRQALVDLGLNDDELRRSGIRLLRLGMMSPVEPGIVRRFAEGLGTLLVVEDKTPFIEAEVRSILCGAAGAPTVIGKKDADGKALVPAGGELTAGRLHAALRRVLSPYAELAPPAPMRIDLPLLPVARAPYFCSGCPHNRSTAVPEGSLAGGGIGCHIMVTTSGREDSQVVGLTQMGGEGAQWIGQAAFSDVGHLFQNVGDGTYFHSGQLAVQACVAAGVDITFKLLYNDVVAMTGAQDAEAALPIDRLTHKLHAERVARIIVCTEDPRRYRRRRLAPGTEVWHRDRLDEAQRELRETKGVTVLIYDQHCAADARRRRKRGQLEARPTRVVINQAVCEGCGDCGVKSNCLSVQPVDTELGRKTRIDQTSCNTDYTCLQGDCPSFMTLQQPEGSARPTVRHPDPPVSPDPVVRPLEDVQNVFMAGIGGTGILTVNQVLATAALMAGLEVETLDQTGLSQKAGPVTGHLRFAAGPIEPANRLSPGSADCVLSFDLLTATGEKSLTYGDPRRTVAVTSTSQTPTGDMVYDKGVAYPATEELLGRLAAVSREVHSLDALAAAERLFGDTTYANFLVVGAAVQAGALRIPAEAVEAAIEVNGTAVARNVAAFRWGRAAVAHPDAFAAAVAPPPTRTPRRVELDPATPVPAQHRDFVERRAADLAAFQSTRTARAYVETVERVARAEAGVSASGELTGRVAEHLYRLTAYKDEYEVARLLTDRDELADVRAEVPGGTRPTYHLHPPALRALGMRSKLTFRPGTHWLLRILARLKFLRGTPLDVFGYAEVRRWERELLRHYGGLVERLCRELDADNYDWARTVAALPELVRGFEDIKLEAVERYVGELERHGVVPPRLGD